MLEVLLKEFLTLLEHKAIKWGIEEITKFEAFAKKIELKLKTIQEENND